MPSWCFKTLQLYNSLPHLEQDWSVKKNYGKSFIWQLISCFFRSCSPFGVCYEGQVNSFPWHWHQCPQFQVSQSNLYLCIFMKLISNTLRTIDSEDYDGSIDYYDWNLCRMKPTGWTGERAKLQDMFTASGFSGILRSVKVRAFNPDTIVPSLVIFLDTQF